MTVEAVSLWRDRLQQVEAPAEPSCAAMNIGVENPMKILAASDVVGVSGHLFALGATFEVVSEVQEAVV